MKTKLFLSIVLLLASTTLFAQNKAAGLNGKTFSIQLTKAEGKRVGWEWTSDEISFSSDKLVSKVMSQREKFEPANVSASADPDGKVHFKCRSKNHGSSKLEWQGTMKDNAIEGTVDWHNRQGTQSYKFSGSLK